MIDTLKDNKRHHPEDLKEITWHRGTVTRSRRELRNGHRSAILWFTGLSGSGKSTIAHAVEERLFQLGCQSTVLDGDNVRHGLCSDLGFSMADRHENIRRISEVARLFLEAGFIIQTAFISPLRADRDMARSLAPEDFFEIYCHCPIDVCEVRDVKGLYKKAREGKIREFTGISSPYEAPGHPDLYLPTNELTIEQSVEKVMDLLHKKSILVEVS